MSLTIDLNNLKEVVFNEKSTGKVHVPGVIKLNDTEIWRKTLTVTFVSNGEVYETQEVKYGGYATMPSDPSSSGLIFGGWSIDGENPIDLTTYQITDSVQFNALFIQANILVTFDGVVTNYATMDEAINYAQSLNSSYSKVAYIKLYQNDTISSDKTITNAICIDLNGYTLDALDLTSSGSNSYFRIEDNLGDGSLNARKISVASYGVASLYSGNVNISGSEGVRISYGDFNLYDGTLNFTSTASYGVYVYNNAGYTAKFKMYGGKITSSKYAIYSRGYSLSNFAKIDIQGGTITECVDTAIYSFGYSEIKIKNCSISGNKEGAITSNGNADAKDRITITDSIIENNITTSKYCTGIRAARADISLTGCEIKNNRGKNGSGALYVETGSKFTLTDCVVKNNSALIGAVAMQGGVLYCIDTNISNNVSTGGGAGGIHYATSSGSVNLQKATNVIYNTCNNGSTTKNIYIGGSTSPVYLESSFSGTIGFTHANGTGYVANFPNGLSNPSIISDNAAYSVQLANYQVNLVAG